MCSWVKFIYQAALEGALEERKARLGWQRWHYRAATHTKTIVPVRA